MYRHYDTFHDPKKSKCWTIVNKTKMDDDMTRLQALG